MTLPDILALAVGLSMDGVAVAAARGLAAPALPVWAALRLGLTFGAFHVLMPLLGWQLGSRLGPSVAAYDHWIAFVLLGGLGAKMLWEAREGGEEPDKPDKDEANGFGWKVLLLLALATSVDAFAVGVTLPLLDAPPVTSLLTIGATAGGLSVVGLYAGRRFGALLGKRVDILGGVVLLGLGLKVLLEHLLT